MEKCVKVSSRIAQRGENKGDVVVAADVKVSVDDIMLSHLAAYGLKAALGMFLREKKIKYANSTQLAAACEAAVNSGELQSWLNDSSSCRASSRSKFEFDAKTVKDALRTVVGMGVAAKLFNSEVCAYLNLIAGKYVPTNAVRLCIDALANFTNAVEAQNAKRIAAGETWANFGSTMHAVHVVSAKLTYIVENAARDAETLESRDFAVVWG